MSRVIEVTMSPQGAITIETRGYVGRDCRQASRFLEEALGEIVHDRPTSESYQTMPAVQHTRQ